MKYVRKRKLNIIYKCMYMEFRKMVFDEPIYRAGIEMQAKRTDLWTEPGESWVRWIEKSVLTHIYYHV